VDIELTEDQRLLQDATRGFLASAAPLALVRKLADSGETYDLAHWRTGAGQGWTALFVPEAYGGIAESSRGLIDGAIVAEELGRVVYPGPFLPGAVAAFALANYGSPAQQEAWLPRLATGERVVASAFANPGPRGGTEPGGVRVVRRGEDLVLAGTAACVEEAQSADAFLVTAVGEDGISQLLVPATAPGLTVEPLQPLDLGRRLAKVRFAEVTLSARDLVGQAGGAAQAFERQFQIAVVLQCAETLGVVDRAFEICCDYTQQRIVFGRPVASYQAIKHRLADHVTQIEGMRAIVAHAAQAVQHHAADAAIAVSIAKSQCGRWGSEIGRDAMYLHGGIGVTWEHDMHFYLRRAVSNEALWGSPAAHHERLCRLAGL